MNFFIDIFAVGLVAVTSLWTFQFFDVLTSGIYNGLIILLFSFPFLMNFLCKFYFRHFKRNFFNNIFALKNYAKIF